MLSKNLIFCAIFFIGIGLSFEETNDIDSKVNEVDNFEEFNRQERRRINARIDKSFAPGTLKTLKDWNNVSLDMQLLSKDGEVFGEFVKMIDPDCVGEKIGLPIDDEKKLNLSEAVLILAPANVLCMKKNGNTVINLITTHFMELVFEGKKSKLVQKSECFYKKLKELDPTSKLLDDFDESKLTRSSDECADFPLPNEVERDIKKLKRLTGDFSVASCGHFTEHDYSRIIITSPFYVITQNEELKMSEKQKIDEFIELKLNQLFECALNAFRNKKDL